MELFDQCGSYPFQEWPSQRRSHHSWEAALPPAGQTTMDYELLSAHSHGNFVEENPMLDGYFLGSGFDGLSLSIDQELNRAGGYCTFGDEFRAQDTPGSSFPVSSVMEEDVFGDEFEASVEILGACKMEPVHSPSPDQPVPVLGGPKGRARRVEGQPSKNLMAERRRRKRLNDRLSMLRSIVPKISKMDRTSILGDTISYMKELLEKIHELQDELESGPGRFNVVQLLRDTKPNEMVVRNSPKFHVERRNEDTRVEVCCTARPGLLLSTVNTLEALGLEIQQCVISCFNDFALQASCSERSMATPEDIEQALFRNAGYGGRHL